MDCARYKPHAINKLQKESLLHADILHAAPYPLQNTKSRILKVKTKCNVDMVESGPVSYELYTMQKSIPQGLTHLMSHMQFRFRFRESHKMCRSAKKPARLELCKQRPISKWKEKDSERCKQHAMGKKQKHISKGTCNGSNANSRNRILQGVSHMQHKQQEIDSVK